MVGLNEMESFTKVKLNDEQLDILVKAVFGSETAVNLSSELTGGFLIQPMIWNSALGNLSF